MKTKLLLASTIILLMGLAGCDVHKVPSISMAPQRQLLIIPALPIIQESVFALSPTFGGQRNVEAMKQVCGLARGELKQEQVDAFLKQQKLDPTKLPKQGNSLSLLVNGDKAAQTTACAAYLATTVLLPVEAGEFMRSVMPPAARPELAPEGGKTMGAETPDSGAMSTSAAPASATGSIQPVFQIDNKSLALVLPIKLAEARANADVFALIAAELQLRPGLTVEQYRELSRQLFSRLAPIYLDRIKAQIPSANATFKLIDLNADRFAFSSSTGSVFEFGVDGLVLRQNGVVWYGQGKLLGMDYPLQVAYFPVEVNKLLKPSD